MGRLFTLILLLTAIPAEAGECPVGPTGIPLERMADTTAPLPGMSELPFIDGLAPRPGGDQVIFVASELPPNFSGSWAYLASSSGVEVMVDEESTVSGSMDTFREIFGPFQCLGHGQIAFLGWESPPSSMPTSIYRWSEGGVSLVQSGGVSLGGTSIGHIGRLSATSGRLAFLAQLEPSSEGVALFVGEPGSEPVLVADSSTILPGQSDPAVIYDLPFVTRTGFVFQARTGLVQGIYQWSPEDGLSIVADEESEVPAGSGTFSGFGLLTELSSGIAFAGASAEGWGIYLASDSGLQPFVTPGVVTTEGAVLASALDPAGGGDLLAFVGSTVEHGTSLFVRTGDGRVQRVVSSGDVIEGEALTLVNAGADQRFVAAHFYTGNGGSVIYRADFAQLLEIPALGRLGQLLFLIVLFTSGVVLLRSRPV